MKKLLLIVLGIAAWCGCAWAESSVWEVRKGDRVIYLGGTCHVLRQSDYPLPVEFEKAYRQAEKLVFEADPGQLTSPRMQQLLAQQAFYRDGRTLQDVLQPKTYRQLEDYCRRSNLTAAGIARLKPSMAALTLLSMELQRHGIDQGGVDLHFYQRAYAEQKAVTALETVEQQIAFMVGMADGREERFMEYSLAELDRLDEIFEALIGAWRSGDEAAIARLGNADFRQLFPEIYRILFTERNAAWLPLIEKFIASPDRELILVGVAHLVGDDGLLNALRRRGYRVARLK